MVLSFAVLLAILCLSEKCLGLTHEGNRFFFAFPANEGKTDGFNQILVTSKQRTNVTVTIPQFGRSDTVLLEAYSELRYPIPGELRMGKGQETKGVSVTSDLAVTIQVSNAVYDSADVFLALPVRTGNTDFMITSYPAARTYQNSLLAVVGTEPNTDVTLYNAAGQVTSQINLNAHDTYQWLQPVSDFSGYRVVANKPVSVLAGNDYTYVPSSIWCCADHMIAQIPPMSSLGTQFVAAPIEGRAYEAGFHIRVYATEDATQVITSTLNETREIDRGAHLDYGVMNMTNEYIQCSKNCMVAQFNQGSQVDITQTDPFMMLLPPTDQYSNNFTFTTPVRFDNSEFSNYVSVVATDYNVTQGILFDNAAIPANWTEVNGTDYLTTAFSIEAGVHTLFNANPDATFTAFLYGHAGIRTEGYGHALGYGNL